MALDMPLDGYGLLQQYRAQNEANALRQQQIAASQQNMLSQQQAMEQSQQLLPLKLAGANIGLQGEQLTQQKTMRDMALQDQQRQALARAMSGGTANGNIGNIGKSLLAVNPELGVKLINSASMDEARKAMEKYRGGQRQPIPSGYRVTASGNLEPIPGGPADTKIQGQLNQDTSMLQNTQGDLDRLALEANRLMNHPGLSKTTGMMSVVPLAGGIATVPGTDASNFKAGLDTLKSQTGFTVLQNMRNNSKTGGALGQVSDFENKMLQANLASLNQAQSEPEFKAALAKIITYTDEAKGRLQNAYNLKHGGRANSSALAAPSNAAPNAPSRISSDAEYNALPSGATFMAPDGSTRRKP